MVHDLNTAFQGVYYLRTVVHAYHAIAPGISELTSGHWQPVEARAYQNDFLGCTLPPHKTVRLLVAVKEGSPSYIRGQQDTTRRYPTEIPAAREAGFPSNPY